MVGLAQLLLKSNAASSLIEDYAACLELRSEESQIIENSSEDPGVLILQVTPVYTCLILSSFTVVCLLFFGGLWLKGSFCMFALLLNDAQVLLSFHFCSFLLTILIAQLQILHIYCSSLILTHL